MDKVIDEIRNLIVETLELEDVLPSDITPDMALFGEGLGLDSIDALEIGIAIQKRFSVKLDAEDPKTKDHFQSVSSLAALVMSNAIREV